MVSFGIIILQSEAELLAEKRCVGHLIGQVHISLLHCCYLTLILLLILTSMLIAFQGIAFCDLPEDTMLPGEM